MWVSERARDGGLRSHAVTTFIGDEGLDMGELAFDAAGATLFYSRGGSLEGGGPVNTHSLASGPVGQAIYAVSVAGGAPRKLADGHAPLPSPAGDVVAYESGGQIFTVPASGGTPTQLIHDRGKTLQAAWSPDGARLAFVSVRGDHALLGVYDMKAKTIVWMSPSVDMDTDPEWSPDGGRIAFIRRPAADPFTFAPRRTGQPWSILVADPTTGDARVVYRAPAGAGSVFHETLTARALIWTAGDNIVFPSEASGWLNLYRVSAKGGPDGPAAVDLTPGAFEVINVAVSADRRRIVYSSAEGDTDRYHLWSITPDVGGPQKRLTDGKGIEDYPLFMGSDVVAALHGDARNPIRPVLVSPDGGLQDLAPSATPKDFPAAMLVEPQAVTFPAADGQVSHGQLFSPPAGVKGRGPALVFFHGGPIRQMLVGWHPMDAYTYQYAMNQRFAAEGYTVLSVNYRGGIGYGLNYREAPNFGPAGSSEVNDTLGAAAYLKSRADVDPARIGVWGGSYGGLMTALALSRASNLFAAGADYAGVHDWRKMLSLPDTSPTGKIAFDASAMATVEKWRSPVLLVHADDDRNVPFDQTVELVRALRKGNVEFQLIVLPDEIHDLLLHRSWITYFHAADVFLGAHLMTK
jgi:dipeptidyl aminopeptidase/acylaminoacyl peptidase